MRVFVLAETYQAYLDWCAKRWVNPGAAVCVTDPWSLRGKMNPNDQLLDARVVRQDLPVQQRVA